MGTRKWISSSVHLYIFVVGHDIYGGELGRGYFRSTCVGHLLFTVGNWEMDFHFPTRKMARFCCIYYIERERFSSMSEWGGGGANTTGINNYLPTHFQLPIYNTFVIVTKE